MRLAIIIEGLPNSGKTSTIRELVNIYANRSLRVMRSGWQRIALNLEFVNLKLDFYCVSASPTETNFRLGDRFSEGLPNVILVALQLNGLHYLDSISFLRENDYTIIHKTILDNHGNFTWHRFNDAQREERLRIRSNEIIEEIRNYISVHII